MARELVVVWAGKHDREPWHGLCQNYAQRIRKTLPIREIVVKVRGKGASRIGEEEHGVRAALPKPCMTVALDSSGKSMSSEQFSQWFQQKREQFPHPMAFLLGSDLGLAPALLEEADLVLAFGRMTFPHELARLMLYEQLYRALAIQQGIKYHRDPF